MKILLLANSDVGLYKFRKELLERLAKENQVFLSLPNGPFVEELVKLGCEYIETTIDRRGTNVFADVSLFFKYLKMINKIKPDIILTYTIKPNIYGGFSASLKNIPYIVNITGLGSALENKGLLQKITTFLYRIGLRKARMVFFQNEANRDFMIERKLVKDDNYQLLPGSGVNLKQYKALKYPSAKTIDFVYVGRMMKEKGFELYLEAAQIIKRKYPHVNFHVCGQYEDNYKKQVDELVKNNYLIYHGLVDDMTAIYKMVSCTIHPTSYPEGLSNVLLESLASARPIITTNRPGCKEVVDNEINGFIVKEKDLDDLVDKIEKFINLPYEDKFQMGLNGRNKVENYFDREIVIDKYLKEINKIKNETN